MQAAWAAHCGWAARARRHVRSAERKRLQRLTDTWGSEAARRRRTAALVSRLQLRRRLRLLAGCVALWKLQVGNRMRSELELSSLLERSATHVTAVVFAAWRAWRARKMQQRARERSLLAGVLRRMAAKALQVRRMHSSTRRIHYALVAWVRVCEISSGERKFGGHQNQNWALTGSSGSIDDDSVIPLTWV